LELRGDRYQWRVKPADVFKRTAEELYRALAFESRTAKSVNRLGQGPELWTQAVNIVLRAKDEILSESGRS
jgi:hypothetical protein